MINIRFSKHAQEQLKYRGIKKEEVKSAIKNSVWGKARNGRLQCKKDFIFKEIWNGKYYNTKQVCPVFVQENEEIIVITVYSYYF